jgi:hypothetical protein
MIFQIESRSAIHSAAMFCYVSFGKSFVALFALEVFVGHEICFLSGEELARPQTKNKMQPTYLACCRRK